MSIKLVKIKKINVVANEDVFDITTEKNHNFFANGVLVHNCEISLNPFLPEGFTTKEGYVYKEKTSGFAFCNLTTINGSLLKSIEDFKNAVKAATIIGTVQAGYTDFKYLSKVSSDICKREALLGVSITGVMDSPEVALNPQYQREMAEYAIEVNEEIANKIGVNPSARITCIKPEGTTGVLLNTASGIHPRYAKKYFRRVQANVNDPVYKHFKENNPHCCEPSVWSANKTDDVITFCVESPKNAITKDDVNAIKFLEMVKSTQENWVIPGTARPDSSPGMYHNVSNTCTVRKDEWDSVAEYIYENRKFFTGISLLGDDGDTIYEQAPHQQLRSNDDEAIWSNYVDSYQKVDYTKLNEREDNTALKEVVACGAGGCEIK